MTLHMADATQRSVLIELLSNLNCYMEGMQLKSVSAEWMIKLQLGSF